MAELARGGPSRAHSVGAALLERAPDDAWAGRTLLQMALPGLASVVRRAHCYVGGRAPVWDDLADLDQYVVALAWERIAELGGSRLEWALRAVQDGVWQRLRVYAVGRRRELYRRRELVPGHDRAARPALSPADELTKALVDAVQAGAIRRVDAGLVYGHRVLGDELDELDHGLSCGERGLRRRRQRAEEKLLAACAG